VLRLHQEKVVEVEESPLVFDMRASVALLAMWHFVPVAPPVRTTASVRHLHDTSHYDSNQADWYTCHTRGLPAHGSCSSCY